LLAADIALVFRHRILGIVNFDVPFLGMHPGIIKAGLGSIFNTPPTPQDVIVQDPMAEKKSSRVGTIFNPRPSDPNYNPAFPNDVHLPVRKGWENSIHWLTKHYKDGLKEATKGLVKSHFEFGSAMADYRELKDRYAKVRALEEDDESKRKTGYPQMRSVPRIRFVNYYTASTGRPKKPKSPKSPSPKTPRSPSPKSPSSLRSNSLQLQHYNSDMSASASTTALGSIDQQLEHHENQRSPSVSSSEGDMTHIYPEPMVDTPRVSIEVHEHRDDGVVSVSPQEPLSATSPVAAHSHNSALDKDGPPNLPEIPPIPQEPPFVDLMQFSDKAQRKAAEKEHDQALKVYQKAVKTRNKTINERTKMEEKWEKDKAKEKKEREKEEKKKQEEAEKAKKEQEKEEQRKQEEMSKEDPLRRQEREQRQAEADQREAEARSRQREADIRDGKTPAQGPPKAPVQEQYKPTPLPADIEEDLGAISLGDNPPPHHSTSSPYTNYAFSQSAIMSQAPPDARADSSYTLSTMDSQNSHQPKRSDTNSSNATNEEKKPKEKKLRKFCMLPPKDGDGNKDPTWIRVFMKDMDEVTAHTSLFFVNETYERLVGDVGDRIEEWVREADSIRLVREMEGLQ
jgi:flagellar biosynthesis GTPase FlhF